MKNFQDFRSRILKKVLRIRILEGSGREKALKLEREHCSEAKCAQNSKFGGGAANGPHPGSLKSCVNTTQNGISSISDEGSVCVLPTVGEVLEGERSSANLAETKNPCKLKVLEDETAEICFSLEF